MKSIPLPAISLKEATELQFSLVDTITRHFTGTEFLSGGDYGLVPDLGKSRSTKIVEETLADFFGQDSAVLVRGAGTGAIRSALYSAFKHGSSILIHKAPLYPTTAVNFDMMGLEVIETDYNDIAGAVHDYSTCDASGALVQLARQKPDDSYDFSELIASLKKAVPELPIITDDNYAVMKVPNIGCQVGSDLSCFSMFKLLGPEGIGCIVGKGDLIGKITKSQYSGGVQVQGPEALDALRSLVYSPVAFALQAQVCTEVEKRLNEGEVPGVIDTFIANAQSRVIIVELEGRKAAAVLKQAAELGAAPYPIGSESRYEITPLFYRVSGTFLHSDPTLADRMIRINPMRSGADTIISILSRALAGIKN